MEQPSEQPSLLTGGRYEIKTFADILNVVTKENLPYFMADFHAYLGFYLSVVDDFREQSQGALDGITNTGIMQSDFTWIDDGINSMTGVRVTDTEGNVTFYPVDSSDNEQAAKTDRAS